MKVIIKNNYQEVSELAAEYLLNTIKNNNNAVLGLPTGSTPIGMYEIVSKEYKNQNLSFKNITTFNLDEYIGLDKTNINSYYYFMYTNLFSKIDINLNNIYIPDGMTKDIEQECKDYENKLIEKGGMDILFLGIGNNGHIGFNEPADYFEPNTHEVQLNEDTIKANSRFFDKVEDVPKSALTMGIKTILSAKKIVLLATGSSKSDAVAKTVNGKVTPQVPASVLQLHNDVTIIIDQEASNNLLI